MNDNDYKYRKINCNKCQKRKHNKWHLCKNEDLANLKHKAIKESRFGDAASIRDWQDEIRKGRR